MANSQSIGYKLQDKFDFGLFIPMLLLILIGLTAIYSSTINHPTASGNFEKQLTWAVISVFFFFVIYFLPPNFFKSMSLPGYGIAIMLLIAVLGMGKIVYGAKSWINLGPVGFQPSEFAKVAVILTVSYWLSRKQTNVNSFNGIAATLAIGMLPVLLILMQPDMGTAIIFIFITLVLLFWAGISLFGLFVVLAPGAVSIASLFGLPYFIIALIGVLIILFLFKRNLFASASVFVFNVAAGFFFDYAFNLLKPHQQKRIETFINPSADPLGHGYNALQAKVAIGSGGLLGKGFLEGNQTQLRFIPEQWTDFIYCVIGEEFGFIGSILPLILFLILFLRLIKLSKSAKDSYSSLVIMGILTLLFIHFAINIGMNVGLAPVIGVPLPFMSYGGSSLLVNVSLLAIAANIYKNRKMRT